MTSCNNFHSFFYDFYDDYNLLLYTITLLQYLLIIILLYFRFFSFDIFFFCGKMCYYYCYKLCRLLGIMNLVNICFGSEWRVKHNSCKFFFSHRKSICMYETLYKNVIYCQIVGLYSSKQCVLS